MVTHRFSLEQARTPSTWSRYRDGVIKAMIEGSPG